MVVEKGQASGVASGYAHLHMYSENESLRDNKHTKALSAAGWMLHRPTRLAGRTYFHMDRPRWLTPAESGR